MEEKEGGTVSFENSVASKDDGLAHPPITDSCPEDGSGIFWYDDYLLHIPDMFREVLEEKSARKISGREAEALTSALLTCTHYRLDLLREIIKEGKSSLECWKDKPPDHFCARCAVDGVIAGMYIHKLKRFHASKGHRKRRRIKARPMLETPPGDMYELACYVYLEKYLKTKGALRILRKVVCYGYYSELEVGQLDDSLQQIDDALFWMMVFWLRAIRHHFDEILHSKWMIIIVGAFIEDLSLQLLKVLSIRCALRQTYRAQHAPEAHQTDAEQN